MKRVKLAVLGLVLVMVPGMVMATGNLEVKILPGEKERTAVFITNSDKSNYEIELVNKKGDIVFYKKTNAPASTYSRYYDFSMLADGEYNFIVKVDNEKKENSLKINKGQVEVTNQRKELEPYFTVRDNRLELSYLNFAMEDVKLMVYQNGELLYNKKLEREFAVNHGLDISRLNAGEYDAVLATENSIFNYRISK